MVRYNLQAGVFSEDRSIKWRGKNRIAGMCRNRKSLFAVLLILCLLWGLRLFYADWSSRTFQWDSLGYYFYLPATFIYHDVAHLQWLPEVVHRYQLPGDFYQAHQDARSGNFVFFYTMGVAVMQAPFFFIGHFLAGLLHYPQDGFSAPYHWAVNAGLLLYITLALFLLRRVLLHFFSDLTTSCVLLLVCLATNFPQYTSVEAGMTHGYLFCLYCGMLFLCLRWQQKPSLTTTGLIGFLTGLAVLIRVTDVVILFIPLFWGITNRATMKRKWKIWTEDYRHFLVVAAGVFLAIAPQLFYWHLVSGRWIYPMGSKWDFLLPHWQVLLGWKKGWFIYTPVTIFMIAGLFRMKRKEYRNAVLIYFLLNVWIITAWHEWTYGASYSARALVQALPVLCFPLGNLWDQGVKKDF